MKFCILLLTLLVGCGTCTQKSPHTLRLSLVEDPTTLDPRLVHLLRDITLVRQLFEGLTRIDREGNPALALASEVAISEDAKHFTFTLRPSQWSDGSPVTAEDFVYAWKSALHPDFPTRLPEILYLLKNGRAAKEGKVSLESVGVLAPNPYTLEVELEVPCPSFLEHLANPLFFPVAARFEEKKSWGEIPIGNGPFRVKRWDPQVRIVFEKNPHYWEAEAVQLQQVEFDLLADAVTATELFLKGSLDFVGQPLMRTLPGDSYAALKAQGVVHSYPVQGTCWLRFQTQALQDVSLRHLLSDALPREEIIAHILQGTQRVAFSPLPGSEARRSRSIPWEGSLPALSLIYATSERNARIAQCIADHWQRELGIRVSLEAMEDKLLRERVRAGRYLIALGDWFADFSDPLDFLQHFSSSRTREETRWEDPEFDALLEAALNESDPARRALLCREAEERVLAGAPVAPLYYCSFDYLMQKEVAGILLLCSGGADLKYATIP